MYRTASFTFFTLLILFFLTLRGVFAQLSMEAGSEKYFFEFVNNGRFEIEGIFPANAQSEAIVNYSNCHKELEMKHKSGNISIKIKVVAQPENKSFIYLN